MRNLVKTLVFLLISTPTYGFINVESIRNTNKLGSQGNIGFKVNGASGNSQTFNSQFNTQWMHKSNEQEYIFLANHSYGESFSDKNASSGQLHARYSRSWTEIIHHEYYTQVEFDEFKDLQLRKLLGLGLRLRFFETESLFFYNGLGFFYEEENIKSSQDQKNLRTNVYFSLSYKINDTLNFSFVQYIQVLANKMADIRLIHDLGFNIKLSQALNFVVQFKHNFDSRPPPTIKNTDLLYLTGLNYNF